MNIAGYDIAVGNDTLLWIIVIGGALMVMAALYIVAAVNAKYPIINFRVNENGVRKSRKYRLYGNLVVRNDIMALILNAVVPLGSNYNDYPSTNELIGNKIETVYSANFIGGLLVPPNAEITKEEAIKADRINRGYIREMRNTKDLTDNQEPLKSELVKVLPIAVLVFIMGLVCIAMFNSANDTNKLIAEKQLIISQQQTETAQNLLQTAKIMSTMGDRIGLPKTPTPANATG